MNRSLSGPAAILAHRVSRVAIVTTICLIAHSAAFAEDARVDPEIQWLGAMAQHFESHPELVGKSGTGYNPYARLRWFLDPRVVDGKYPPTDVRLEVWREQQGRPATGSDPWFSLGPSNEGGRVLSMTFDPSNSTTLYAGAAGGGLWRTTNAGNSWAPLTDDYPFIAIGGVAVNPLDPAEILIATGQGQGGSVRIDGVGVWKSTDAGSSWYETSITYDRSITNGYYFVKARPEDGVVYAGSRDSLSMSTDFGETWTTLLTEEITDVAFDPGTQRMYAIQRNGSNRGILVSTDGGATWVNKFNDGSNTSRGRIVVSRSNRNILYALLGSSDDNGWYGVLRSNDRGETWTVTNSDHDLTNGKQSFIHQALAIRPNDPNTVIVGGVQLMRSTDGGVTFTRIDSGNVPHADNLGAIWDPVAPGRLWVWGDGGVWRSPDNGDNWIALSNDFRNFQIYDIGTSASSASVDVLFGGAQDNGIQRRISGGTEWENVNSGDGMVCLVHATDPNYVFATIQNGTHFRSTDGGATFETMETGLSDEDGIRVTPKVADPNDPETMFTSTKTQIFRATNASTCTTCWSSVDNTGQSAVSLAVSPVDGNIVWAVMEDGTVRRSSDGGSSFSQVADLSSSGTPTQIAAHPADSARAFVTLSGYGTGVHVLTTGNDGATWFDRTTNLPDVPVNAIAIPQDHHAVYVATDVGVYSTTNQGDSWEPYGTDLPFAIVTDLEIHEASGVLVASTFGRGAWVVNLPATSNVDDEGTPVASNLLLAAPVPNPVADVCTFRFAAHSEVPVNLDVFDVGGRLVEHVASAGSGDGAVREVVWDASQVAPGVYFAALRAGEARVVRKVTVAGR
ncbi:MAG: hypothetical protein H6682_19490 [Candidatus Eisenbacteria bacterium]|nr:hypothetical protein [Candidatus Eisenbacteria bacterium]